MIQVKPSERPPYIRYVIRNADKFYYDGHGYLNQEDGKVIGEAGMPGFNTKKILEAIKYGDLESIEILIKNHKKWCIDNNREDKDFKLFDTCEVLETYT